MLAFHIFLLFVYWCIQAFSLWAPLYVKRLPLGFCAFTWSHMILSVSCSWNTSRIQQHLLTWSDTLLCLFAPSHFAFQISLLWLSHMKWSYMSCHLPLLSISSLCHGFCCPLYAKESQFHTDGSSFLAWIIVINCYLMNLHHFWSDTNNSAPEIKVIFQNWILSMLVYA